MDGAGLWERTLGEDSGREDSGGGHWERTLGDSVVRGSTQIYGELLYNHLEQIRRSPLLQKNALISNILRKYGEGHVLPDATTKALAQLGIGM